MGISVDLFKAEPVPEPHRRIVDAFVLYEGQLADEYRLKEWEALWANDASYWVPIGWDDYDPRERVSLIFEDRAGIASRIVRLDGTAAYAEEPRSRVRRVIGDRQITALGNGEYQSVANLVLYAVRRDVPTVWGGRMRHRVRITGDTVELVEKVVWLLNNDAYLSSLGFLL